MGFLDFLFGKKKDEQTKANSYNSSKSTQNPQTPKHEQPQTKPAAPKQTVPIIEPFVFKSDCHQRFENGSEVMGLQQCIRTVSIEKNTNGCRGYKVNPDDGYIIKIFNDDLGKPNMSDKPMRIVSKTADKVELRGFPIEAQTPFGWQEVDYRDYGLTVYYTNGTVSKCVLHMFDRSIDLEYRISSVSTSENRNDVKELSDLDKLAIAANADASRGSKHEAQLKALKIFNTLSALPNKINSVSGVEEVALALGRLMEGEFFTENEDVIRAVGISYYFLSKAIKAGSSNPHLFVYRFSTTWEYNKAFYRLFAHSEGTELSMSPFDIMGQSAIMAYDHHLQGMQMADALQEPKLVSLDPALGNIFRQTYSRYNMTPKSQIVNLGNKYHDQIYDYLETKIKKSDLSF